MARRAPFSAILTALFVLVLFHEICSAKASHPCPSSCGEIRNISCPFRLKDCQRPCGGREYPLSCENNHTVADISGKKYYVRHIDYTHNITRLVDPATLQDNYSFIPHYFRSHYHIGSQYSVDPERSRSVVFLICEKPVMKSPLYYHLPACFDDGGDSYNSSFPGSKRYRYVQVGGMLVSEVEDFCQVEGMFLTSLLENDGPDISCSHLRSALQYGFELSHGNSGGIVVVCESSGFIIESNWDQAVCTGMGNE